MIETLRIGDHDVAVRGRVLEVGAGREGRRGRFVPPVEDAGCWVSLDLTREHRPHLAGNVLALPFSDAAFDSVLCLEVLEYVPDYPHALAEPFYSDRIFSLAAT